MTTYQPTEADWKTYGTVVVGSRFGSRVLGFALWGMQAFMVLSCFSMFFKLSKQKRKDHLRFLVFGAAILASTSIAWSLQLWAVFRNLFGAGPDPRSYVEAFWANTMSEIVRRAQITTIVCNDITIIAADALMLWRAHVVWTRRRSILVFPSMACVGSAAVRFSSFVRMASAPPSKVGPLTEFLIASESLSVFVYVSVTGLILVELMSVWSLMSKACPQRKCPPMYSTAAARIIESAAPLTLCGIWFIIATAMNVYWRPTTRTLTQAGTLNAVVEFSGVLYYSSSALSSQMIIFRVFKVQSRKTTQESRHCTQDIPSESLQFIVPLEDPLLTSRV